MRGGWLECAALLLEAGCDPDRADPRGRTPLHAAAARGSLELTRLLLEHEADTDAIDEDGVTPEAVARSWVGKDVEAELRLRVAEMAPEGAAIETRHTIRVSATLGDGGVLASEQECSHDEIAALLERTKP